MEHNILYNLNSNKTNCTLDSQVLRTVKYSGILVTPLFQSIESKMMDRFWCSRCLNNSIGLFYMIGSFAGGANVSLVVKNGTKKIIPLLWIKSSKKPQIKKFHKKTPTSGNFDSKYNFEIFKNQKSNSKKTP